MFVSIFSQYIGYTAKNDHTPHNHMQKFGSNENRSQYATPKMEQLNPIYARLWSQAFRLLNLFEWKRESAELWRESTNERNG